MGGEHFFKNEHQIGEESVNFFSQSPISNDFDYHFEPSRRLNDYDYNILKEDAYKDVTDETFKLEYKISKLEEEINDIDSQIQAANDVRDFEQVEALFGRRRLLKEELSELVEIYNATSLSAKISGGITNIISPGIKRRYNVLRNFIDSIQSLIVSKLPRRVAKVLEIKKSLSKLENINKSVDELMTMQTPYGELGDKYVQLSKYITRANAIQAEISRTLR